MLLDELLRRRGLCVDTGGPVDCAGRTTQTLPCSPGQRSLWMLDRLKPGSPFYNICFVLWVEGNVDLAAMSPAIVEQDGEPMQKIRPARPFEIVRRERPTGAAPMTEWVHQEIEPELRRPFDLSLGMPIIVSAFRLGQAEHALTFVVHHIAADGWSLTHFAQGLAHFYKRDLGYPVDGLPELPPYADFVWW